MEPRIENALMSVGKDVISEFTSKSNTLTYREILDKHSPRIALLLPPEFPAWMWLNVYTQRVAEQK